MCLYLLVTSICLGKIVLKMGTLHGPVICRPDVHAKNGRFPCPLINPLSTTKRGFLTSGFLGSRKKCRIMIRVGSLPYQQCDRKNGLVRCNFSSSSNGNGGTVENFSLSDEEYVNSSVIEAGNDYLHTTVFLYFLILYLAKFYILYAEIVC